jgi:hypothetical protein
VTSDPELEMKSERKAMPSSGTIIPRSSIIVEVKKRKTPHALQRIECCVVKVVKYVIVMKG